MNDFLTGKSPLEERYHLSKKIIHWVMKDMYVFLPYERDFVIYDIKKAIKPYHRSLISMLDKRSQISLNHRNYFFNRIYIRDVVKIITRGSV